MILSFSGHRHQVMPLMQNLSHTTRAFIINANTLPGFIQSDIFRLLKQADEAGQLQTAKKYQLIDMSIIKKKLNSTASKQLKMEFLANEYPSLFVFILE